MSPFFRNMCLLFAAVLPAACSEARTEVVGNTLATNVKPYISITGAAPLVVQGHGRLWPLVATDTTSAGATASFDYALYADTDNGPVTRYAYAAITRLSQPKGWRFTPQSSRFDGAFSVSNRSGWNEQLLRVPREGDWSSDIWKSNGRAVPEYWLAKRVVTNMTDAVRVVMEYREPWPDVIDVVSLDIVSLRGAGAEELRAFIARADAAFVVEKKKGAFTSGVRAPQATLVVTQTQIPDYPKLVGAVVAIADN